MKVNPFRERTPGLSDKDGDVWRNWQELDPVIRRRARFNIRVGNGKHAACQRMNWAALPGSSDWQKRVDVLIETPDIAWVVELKPWATGAACGQAMLYADLLELERGQDFTAVPCVVGAHTDADLLGSVEEWPVALWVAEERRWAGRYAELGGWLTGGTEWLE